MSTTDDSTTPAAPRRRRAASRPAGPPADPPADAVTTEAGSTDPVAAASADLAPADAVATTAPAPRARKRAAKKSAPKAQVPPAATQDEAPEGPASNGPAATTGTRSRTRKATSTRSAAEAAGPGTLGPEASGPESSGPEADPTAGGGDTAADGGAPTRRRARASSAPAFSASDGVPAAPEPETAAPGVLMFQAPVAAPAARSAAPARRRSTRPGAVPAAEDGTEQEADDEADRTPSEPTDLTDPDQPIPDADEADEEPDESGPRRRRRRGGRGRRRRAGEQSQGTTEHDADGEPAPDADQPADGTTGPADTEESEPGESTGTSRRRRRRRGGGGSVGADGDDSTGTTTRSARSRRGADEITAIKGSTRLEAKKQRRREGREAGRRRPPILSEAEFLARREAVERVMVVRQIADGTQIAVLEDGVLVEHYVNRSTGASMIGNVYLGKVQNVLPSMEAAFVDIGRGRNAVLYAGEVNWDAAGLDGQPRRIEAALKSGDSVLVQVSKDPIGHKGARLTSQISLPGRFLVYVPEGQMTGISRKLPDTERNRLKSILRTIMPEDAGVIVRTASEGVSEEELTRDVQRLSEQWEQITAKAASSSAPVLLQGEQDLAIKVVRDIFNEDFTKLVVAGERAWQTVESYVAAVAPELVDRLEKWVGTQEVFHAHRVDEQLAKALDRKVWLPSGGSLVIDRTEAMTVVDVNTGKFTGSGGNLEETVTRNNLEAAEEIVRQLRLRDIGGIIVVDFIDMVLESNRDLVLRRLLECLGRDRTKHQVAEVTSLGLVQMTRKRIGQGLLEVFSEPCEHCHGRGVLVHSEPVAAQGGTTADPLPAIRSASATAGVAKVHAAARKAAAGAPDDDAAVDEADSPAAAQASEPADMAPGPGTEPEPLKDTKAKTGKKAKVKAGKKAAGGSPDGAVVGVPDLPAADGAAPAPTPRARGGRRRVTRSAGPATHEEPREAPQPAV